MTLKQFYATHRVRNAIVVPHKATTPVALEGASALAGRPDTLPESSEKH